MEIDYYTCWRLFSFLNFMEAVPKHDKINFKRGLTVTIEIKV